MAGVPSKAGRRALAAAAVLVVAWLFIYWTEPLALFSLAERLTPAVVYRVETDRPLVALSFDDGPHPIHTPQVLDVLERHDAQATFFLIGERALRHPELVARIKAAGHEVGNHYFMNRSTLPHSDADFIAYLERTEKAAGVTGPLKLFRPPGGVAWPRQLRLARERGYPCVLGSAYPHDPVHPPAWYIRWLTEKNLTPGAIVVLHDGISDPTRSIEALPHILAAGRRRGLRFVSLGTLMSAAGERRGSR
jgi:peptidoglycan/xylan/chitin deacetylase (PgdA/CDA1 family)